MSKGSPIISVRIPPLMLAAMESAVVSANKVTKGPPYTLSSWILSACAQKLAHNARGGSGKKAQRRGVENGTLRASGASGEIIPDLWRQFHAQSAGARP